MNEEHKKKKKIDILAMLWKLMFYHILNDHAYF
jgi:hypothetical protein